MSITVNGLERPIAGARSVTDVLAALELPHHDVAVAVDGAVVPRSRWEDTPVPDGAQVEVVTARQGG